MKTRLTLLLLLSALVAVAATPRPPNVIFILVDDLGWGDLGCYGHPHIKTPNIDRMAREGTLFTQFYVNGSVCSPSRTAFMTGQYPARHRVHSAIGGKEQNAALDIANWLDPKVPTLPAVLQEAGYATAHFGKWHLGKGQGAPLPTAYGFNESRAINGNGPTWDEPDVTFRAKSSAAIVDETIRFIRANKDKPFYVHTWMLIPHATLNTTEEQMKPYEKFQPAGNPALKSAGQVFYGAITDMDKHIGRLLAAIDQLGLAEDTLVFFSSDNGPEDIHVRNAGHSGIGSAGPFRGRKRSLYEGGIRVPGIVRWKGHVPAGKIDDTSVVAGVDWLPTIAKLANAPVPASHKLDGEDASDVMLGQSRARKGPLFWEWRLRVIGEPFHQSPVLAMREGDWKFLMNPGRSRVELYDIKKDLTQLNNVAEKNPQIVARLGEQLLSWQRELPPGPAEPGNGAMTYGLPGKKAASAADADNEDQPPARAGKGKKGKAK